MIVFASMTCDLALSTEFSLDERPNGSIIAYLHGFLSYASILLLVLVMYKVCVRLRVPVSSVQGDCRPHIEQIGIHVMR